MLGENVEFLALVPLPRTASDDTLHERWQRYNEIPAALPADPFRRGRPPAGQPGAQNRDLDHGDRAANLGGGL
jgi:hypothetical protein